jgi:hypothetical protein
LQLLIFSYQILFAFEIVTFLTCIELLIEHHSSDKRRAHKGSSGNHPCVDLIIVDQPKGLPVPGISNLISSVPLWNQDSKEWLEPIFDFADQHLQDDGAFIILHPFRLSTKSNILGYCKSYGFEIRKEWWGMNRLHLTSAVHPTSTVSSKPIFSALRCLVSLVMSSHRAISFVLP